uniref:DNA-directed RNA polymerase n=1 Tax=Fucus vesiculosus TaxID=49266 RepID=D1GJR1_FUCVE|nr:DNA-directed RNA polymerase alpha chain [Fucus vesiculosus]CAX12520.1 DNA-directed RNA polymerase alpha chain [Fucus vesiculosus]
MLMSSKCKCVDLDLLNTNEFYGHFVFTALEKSQGNTIGNVLRRTLLSNLYGFRIVGVRFAGINNEFALLEGVREDLFEIILNLKEIIILNSNRIDQTCYGRLKVYGPAVITAGSLELPNNVKILNPNNHLLTISDESLIEIEVKIEAGKSYILAKDQKLEGALDFIPIDSNFAPVLKVNWYIISLPQDGESINEELHLEIYTNGTLLPHQALLQARTMIGYMLSPISTIEFSCLDTYEKEEIHDTNHIKSLTYITDPISRDQNKTVLRSNLIKNKSKFEKINLDKINQVSIDEQKLIKNIVDLEYESLKNLGLSNRIINALNKVNINFISDLIHYPSSSLINIVGLGPKSVEEIKNKLNQFSESPKRQ